MVDKYIKELLIEHGRVYIPNLGLIFKDYKNNDYPSDPYTLSYPKSLYLIDEEYTSDDDTWLAYAIARGEHVTLEEADVLLKERVDNIKYSLKDGSSVEIEELGTIINNSGKLSFNINSEFINQEADDNFGIPSHIAIDRDDQENSSYEENQVPAYEDTYNSSQEDPIYDDPLYEDERLSNPYIPEKKKSSTFAIAATIIFILMAGLVLVYFLYFMPSNSDMASNNGEANTEALSEDTTKDSTQVAEASIGDSMEPAAENKTGAIPLSVPEKGKRYYIIAGAFSVNENAQKLKRDFKSKGVKAKIIGPKDSEGLYRVSLADYDNFAQALAKTQDMRSRHGNSIWILKY